MDGAANADGGEPFQSPATKVGAELRAARLRLGWALDDVASGLRIRLPYLQALEEGRVSDLPGSAYALGFLRAYAKSLGLDPDEVARRFRSEAHEVNRKTELTFPVPVPERGVPAGAVVLLGLVLAVGAYAAWYKFAPQGGGDSGVATVPDRLAPLAERQGGTLSPQVASILPTPVPPPLTPILPAPAPIPAQPAASASTAAQAAPILPVIPVPVPVPVTLTPTSPAAANPAQPPGVDPSRVTLRFKADSYVQVREKQGPVLLNRVMRAGESWRVPKQPNLVMLTGNAGGTEITVDGVQAAPLGSSGAVRRDVALDPDAIKLPPGVKLPPEPRPQ